MEQAKPKYSTEEILRYEEIKMKHQRETVLDIVQVLATAMVLITVTICLTKLYEEYRRYGIIERQMTVKCPGHDGAPQD